jgi:hypothetical protein
MKAKAKKTQRASKPKTKTAYAKIEKALASTATLATEIARGTERRIREITASAMSSDAHGARATDPIRPFVSERLLATTPGHEAFKARTKALMELMVNHHKEEERELFPKARKAMSKEAECALGDRMRVLFDDTVQRGYKEALASRDGKNGSAKKKTGTTSPRQVTRD